MFRPNDSDYRLTNTKHPDDVILAYCFMQFLSTLSAGNEVIRPLFPTLDDSSARSSSLLHSGGSAASSSDLRRAHKVSEMLARCLFTRISSSSAAGIAAEEFSAAALLFCMNNNVNDGPSFLSLDKVFSRMIQMFGFNIPFVIDTKRNVCVAYNRGIPTTFSQYYVGASQFRRFEASDLFPDAGAGDSTPAEAASVSRWPSSTEEILWLLLNDHCGIILVDESFSGGGILLPFYKPAAKKHAKATVGLVSIQCKFSRIGRANYRKAVDGTRLKETRKGNHVGERNAPTKETRKGNHAGKRNAPTKEPRKGNLFGKRNAPKESSEEQDFNVPVVGAIFTFEPGAPDPNYMYQPTDGPFLVPHHETPYIPVLRLNSELLMRSEFEYGFMRDKYIVQKDFNSR